MPDPWCIKRITWTYNLLENRYVCNCCVLIITETWLHPDIPDASMQLAGRTLLRGDRTKDSGKSKGGGGGLCTYVHNNWCNNGTIIDRHCSPDVEYMSVRCRPFFLPRELTVVIVTAVYIPPDASVNTALSLLLNTINEQQWAHPNGVHIIAGDFNKANLKTVLPKFYQHVKCATRGESTLDHVYTNIKHAYRTIPLPQLERTGGVAGHTGRHKLQRLWRVNSRPECITSRGAKQLLCSVWIIPAALICSSPALTPTWLLHHSIHCTGAQCQTGAPGSEPQEGCRPRRSTWQGAQSVCQPARPHLHQDFQPLPGPARQSSRPAWNPLQ